VAPRARQLRNRAGRAQQPPHRRPNELTRRSRGERHSPPIDAGPASPPLTAASWREQPDCAPRQPIRELSEQELSEPLHSERRRPRRNPPPQPQPLPQRQPRAQPEPSCRLATPVLEACSSTPQGRTLYLFEKDPANQSACSGACAAVWPPLTTKSPPVAGHGAIQSQLGTTHRSGGILQVTYHGHPLYLYVGDSRAGQTTGEGLDQFGAPWWAISAAGQKITS
jgi:predicted lipoprotein with Yx(FWY)xxD motif